MFPSSRPPDLAPSAAVPIAATAAGPAAGACCVAMSGPPWVTMQRLSVSRQGWVRACVREYLDVEEPAENVGDLSSGVGEGVRVRVRARAGRLPSPPYKPRAPPNRCHFRLAYLLAHSSGFNVHVPQQKFTCNTHTLRRLFSSDSFRHLENKAVARRGLGMNATQNEDGKRARAGERMRE